MTHELKVFNRNSSLICLINKLEIGAERKKGKQNQKIFQRHEMHFHYLANRLFRMV